jgi:hypothetical protein
MAQIDAERVQAGVSASTVTTSIHSALTWAIDRKGSAVLGVPGLTGLRGEPGPAHTRNENVGGLLPICWGLRDCLKAPATRAKG